MAVSGLVRDRDFIHMITEAQSLIEREKQHGRTETPDQSDAHAGAW
jgi:hypothetical protein